tara:strand:+ start:5422 stop:5793 length:372 start_codon:yes stop_codon:yes gene_type:complete
MAELLRKYITQKEGVITPYDEEYIERIFSNMMKDKNNTVSVECHGLHCDELLYFLEFLDYTKYKMKIKFITGVGKHSKKPHMDYFCSKIWNCPLKQTIIDYYVKSKRGAFISVRYSHIIVKLR